jgi:hypothetical protein
VKRKLRFFEKKRAKNFWFIWVIGGATPGPKSKKNRFLKAGDAASR